MELCQNWVNMEWCMSEVGLGKYGMVSEVGLGKYGMVSQVGLGKYGMI